jgi:predicted metal-dependent hydrolase
MTEAPSQPIAYSPPSPRCAEPPTPALLKGIDQFNLGLFFEQHETLEDAWIEESDPIRYLFQGILQIGVGFHHLRRGNFRGAISLIERGTRYLQPFAPTCMGVDVARLLAEAARARSALLELGPERLSAFDPSLVPQVHLIANDTASEGFDG